MQDIQNETCTTIDLLRHGEPVGGKRFRGSTDDPLSEAGWLQMENATTGVSEWDIVLTSPLKRCAEFANSIAERKNISVETIPDLQEIHFGHWEGLNVDEVMLRYPGELARFWDEHDNFTPADAESVDDFQLRISKAINDLVFHNSGKRCLVVCHGGVIHAAIAHWLEIPLKTTLRINAAYACSTRFQIYRDNTGAITPTLLFHGGQF